MSRTENVPAAVTAIAARLRECGHRALLVGGCVRDMLLGREPKDYDIATDAPPQRLLALFPGAQNVGAHFGVVLVDGVEIATFRRDGSYDDGRHPSSVTFETDPRLDAGRRDFTINGMFLDPFSGELLDFVGGRDDLANGVVRAIGDPGARFGEDHLRLLRAVRFAARFAFDVHADTAAAIAANPGRVLAVAVERNRDELSRILTEGGARYGFELLDRLGLLVHLLPEVKAMKGVAQPAEYHPEGDVWNHTLLLLAGLDQPTVPLAWGALLHDVGKPPTFRVADRIRFDGHAEVGARMAVEILGRLRYPHAVTEEVRDLVRQHMRFMDTSRMKPATLKRFLRQPHFETLLELHRLDCMAGSGKLENYRFCRETLAALPPEVLQPPPLLTGRDLMAMGIAPGPELGRLLRLVEDAQLDGLITTAEEARELAARERASAPSST